MVGVLIIGVGLTEMEKLVGADEQPAASAVTLKLTLKVYLPRLIAELLLVLSLG